MDGQVLYVATQQCGEPGEEDASGGEVSDERLDEVCDVEL